MHACALWEYSSVSSDMAPPLVRYSSRLVCRSNSRFVMSPVGSGPGDTRLDARYIAQDFLEGVESLIALKHDGRWSVTFERIIKKFERFIGNWLGMGIGEQRWHRRYFAHANTPPHVNLCHHTRLSTPEK